MAKKAIKVGADYATIDAPVALAAFDGSWSGLLYSPHSTNVKFTMKMALFQAMGRQYELRQSFQAGKISKLDCWQATDMLKRTLATEGAATRDKLALALAREWGAPAIKKATPPTSATAPAPATGSVARAAKAAGLKV